MVLVYILGILYVVVAEDYQIVETSFGKVRGKRIDSYGGQSGFAFAGVPMAQPPIDELRFREAKYPNPWNEIKDTFQYQNACLADPVKTFKTYEGNPVGPMSEDCLYLNIFTSRICLNLGGCAVMVVYHGGNMKFESPVLFPMDIIVNNFANDERNIIVVTAPYRLGAIGWFHLTKDFKTSLDSNLGTKDAIFALQWIQKEIKTFGGDPGRVTIYGHSAGAVLTQHLATLPATDGLFHQMISQSGPADVVDFSRSVNIAASRAVAEDSNCAQPGEKYNNLNRIEEIIRCMKSRTGEQLIEATLGLNNRVEETAFSWIEDDGILTTYKKELMKKLRKMPVLIGATTAELRLMKATLDSTGATNVSRVTELCTHIGYWKAYKEPERFVKECSNFYMEPKMAEMFDDHIQFYQTVMEYANKFTKAGSNVYVYSYDYWGAGSAFAKYAKGESIYKGPAHSEDFIYILGMHRNTSGMKAKDFLIERIYSGMVANFINTGKPAPEGYNWNPWSIKEKNYFLIDFDKNLRMPGERAGYYPEVYEFWEKIVSERVGDWTPLEIFPERNDNSDITNIFSYILTAWTGYPEHIEKTARASMEAYHLWSNFVNNRQNEFRQKGILQFKAGNISLLDGIGKGIVEIKKPEFNCLTLVLAITVMILVGYIVVMKVAVWRKRKEYQQLYY